MGKKIIITEEQYIFLTEGIKYGDRNGYFTASINNYQSDKENLSGNFVDTRIFGDRNSILYGDGTNNRLTSLSDIVLQRRAIITTMNNLIEYINNGRHGVIFTDKNLPKTTINSVNTWLKTMNDKNVLEKAYQTRNVWIETAKQKEGLYNRANMATGNKKIPRYTIFEIGNTGINCIALFAMKDFTLSDTIKHGKISKGNPIIIEPSKYDIGKDGNIGVRYDDIDTDVNVAQNFSLNNVSPDHFKTQYNKKSFYNKGNDSEQGEIWEAVNNDNTYTTINQFIDKSIIYANFALKNENFIPDIIVTVPSSSKMNHYYAINLSRKIGCNYIDGFFKRNIINAHLKDNLTDEDLYSRGFSPLMVEQLKKEIKNYAYQEITYLIEEPIRKVVNDNIELFSNISKEKNKTEKFDLRRVMTLLSLYCFRTIRQYLDKDDAVCKHMCRSFCALKEYGNDSNMLPRIIDIFTYKIGKKTLDNILIEMRKLLIYYKNEVDKGYYPGSKQYGLGRAKITRIPKAYREYVEGSFIISDKYAKENSHFFNSLKDKKILIIDEDINTGSSFQLAIESVKTSIEDKPNNTIMCLANGYSEAGNRFI